MPNGGHSSPRAAVVGSWANLESRLDLEAEIWLGPLSAPLIAEAARLEGLDELPFNASSLKGRYCFRCRYRGGARPWEPLVTRRRQCLTCTCKTCEGLDRGHCASGPLSDGDDPIPRKNSTADGF